MKIIDCEQGSPEWITARLGKVSASRIADMTATTKNGYSISRANYAAELIVERLTGASGASGYTNAAMEWGTMQEPAARAMYEFISDMTVTRVGLVLHPAIEMSCASPDGLAGEDGLIEIKCPNTATQIETLLSEKIPEKYVKQMQWQMACTGRAWCDFVSFDPRLPVEMQIFIARLKRDDLMVAALENETRKFLDEINSTISALTSKYAKAA